MTAHHHCGCPKLPQDFEARLREESHIPEHTIPYILQCAGLAPTSEGFTTPASRFAYTDDLGHLLYLGKMPSNRAQPLLTLNGERVPASRYAMTVFGGFDYGSEVELRRNFSVCTVHNCFSPAHWQPVAGSPDPETPSILDLIFEARYGFKPNPRPTKWDTSSPAFERCPRDHPLKVYELGDGRRRSYCAACYADERAWVRTKADFDRHLRIDGPNPVERFLVDQWNSRPDSRDPYGRLWLASIWQILEHHYAANPADARSPAEVHEALTGTGAAPDLEPEAPTQTMQEAVDAMFADLTDV